MHRTRQPAAEVNDQAATDGPALDPTPAEILRGAALYLRRHGWNQGDYFAPADRPTPPACLLGAVAMAIYGHRTEAPYSQDRPGRDLFVTVADSLDTYLQLHHGDLDMSAVGWNDHPNRTLADVLDLLHTAAAIWDRQHRGGAR